MKHIDTSQPADTGGSSGTFVRLAQAAQQAKTLCDEAVATGANPQLAQHLREHAVALKDLRDRLHDELLTEEDIGNGAIPRRPDAAQDLEVSQPV